MLETPNAQPDLNPTQERFEPSKMWATLLLILISITLVLAAACWLTRTVRWLREIREGYERTVEVIQLEQRVRIAFPHSPPEDLSTADPEYINWLREGLRQQEDQSDAAPSAAAPSQEAVPPQPEDGVNAESGESEDSSFLAWLEAGGSNLEHEDSDYEERRWSNFVSVEQLVQDRTAQSMPAGSSTDVPTASVSAAATAPTPTASSSTSTTSRTTSSAAPASQLRRRLTPADGGIPDHMSHDTVVYIAPISGRCFHVYNCSGQAQSVSSSTEQRVRPCELKRRWG